MESIKIHTKEVDDLKQIMKNIESKTEQMVLLGYKTGQLVTPDKSKASIRGNIQGSTPFLQGIMQQGSNEFEQKVGRPMTYSEMREMYG